MLDDEALLKALFVSRRRNFRDFPHLPRQRFCNPLAAAIASISGGTGFGFVDSRVKGDRRFAAVDLPC